MSANQRIKSRKGSPADDVARLLAKRNGRNPGTTSRKSTAPGFVKYDVLGRLLAQKRAQENLSLRDVAKETGLSN